MATQDDKIEGGYIILARRIVDSEIWEKPAAWLKVWLHIKLKVNWKDKGHIKKGQGFFNWQREKSALRGVTRHQWEKAVIWLRNSGTVATQKASRGMIITVLNYDRYQDQELYKSGTESEHRAGKKRNRSGTIIEALNNSKSSSNIYNIHNGFKEFWDAYPKRKNKGDARKAWKVIKPCKELFEKIMDSVKTARGLPGWTKEDGRFIPYPATWLRAEGWEDVHEVQAEPEPERQVVSVNPRTGNREIKIKVSRPGEPEIYRFEDEVDEYRAKHHENAEV